MRRPHPRARLISLALALSALTGAVGPVQASNPPLPEVDLVECLATGESEVAAGTPFVLDLGWGALTPRHELAFFLSQRTVASIDGAPIRFASLRWRLPERTFPFPDLPWNMPWNYRVGAKAPGDSIDVAFEIFLRFPVSDGVDSYPSGPLLGPAGFFPSCTITAV